MVLFCVSVCISVCLSTRTNLGTGAGRHLTEGTSGLSGPFSKRKKAFSLKLLCYKVRCVISLPGTKPVRVRHFAMFRIPLHFTSIKLMR